MRQKKYFIEHVIAVHIFSRVLRDSTPCFVGPSVHPSVTLYIFWVFVVFDEVTLNMAPTHPHVTGVAVYPALLFYYLKYINLFILKKKKRFKDQFD